MNNNDNNKLIETIDNLNFRKKFLEKRKLFFWGPVFDDSAKVIVDQLMYLEMIDPGKEITLFINSPGGSVTSGLSIYDTMQMISSPISTICMGMAASMGSVLLSGGTKGKRFIYPNGEVMIHQPSISSGFQDRASNLIITAQEIKKTKIRLSQILADNCGKSLEQLITDSDRDYWMDAQESVDYGIVDGIIEKIIF
ncbi:MAG: ATP-dependent Clp protease proteolytic subunit [Bacteroidales bacterium]|nr:ATP-dependent Clp protease proteolytic subunit [Bacteroidales bacterium]